MKDKLYYIVSVRHTSKGDTALTFWSHNFSGYAWNKKNCGLYTEVEAKKCISDDNIMVPSDIVDKFWMNALDFKDEYVAVPNTPTVLFHLGISDKMMKSKKYASCRMTFINTPTVSDAVDFLDDIREYERESGIRICDDERTSEELYEIFKQSKQSS